MLDDDFLLLVNAWWEPLDFAVPDTRPGQTWTPVVDTYEPTGLGPAWPVDPGEKTTVHARSIVVLRGR